MSLARPPNGVSFDFVHLDRALKASWPAWSQLIHEIEEFAPRDLSQDPCFRRELLDHYRSLNPDSPDTELEVIVDWRAKSEGSVERQFMRQFDGRLMNAHVTVAVLSLALCEALINCILAVGFVVLGEPDRFVRAERYGVRRKWLVEPQAFAPSYSLPPESALAATLHELTERRNSLVHHKVNVFRDGQKVVVGSDWKVYPYDELVIWTDRFFSLPYDLVQNALACGEISSLGATLDRGHIPAVDHLPRLGKYEAT